MQFVCSVVTNNLLYYRFVGIFEARQPIYFLRDLELIRQVCIKDFNYFCDRPIFIGETSDKFFNNTFFNLKSEKWRNMRTTLMPAFSGSKMKLMFELMSEVANDACQFLKEKGCAEYDIKSLLSRYANDIIATCAFGHKVDSMKNDQNDFFQAGEALEHFAEFQVLRRTLLVRLVPNFVGLRVIETKLSEFIVKMVVGTMDVREKENIYRPDLLNVLMKVRTSHEWSDLELAAQCFSFYFAGYQTVSTVLTFTAYELAVNQHVQNRLFDEINAMHKQLDGKPISYDSLNELVYLDQVLNESLRKWPPATVLRRQCVQDYNYNHNSVNLLIEKGICIVISVYGIQRDPKYWPDPEKFDPERFNSVNKSKIIAGSFLPFGLGPRSCLGTCCRSSILSSFVLIFAFHFHRNEIRYSRAKSNILLFNFKL